MSLAKRILIEFSRKQALELGLLLCTCGHPPNNHFMGSGDSCAHCECKKYKERVRCGIWLNPELDPQKIDQLPRRPFLLPGDIVGIKENGSRKLAMGVITEAQVVINGRRYDWCDKIPEPKKEPGTELPSYAIEALPFYQVEKVAWWQAKEFHSIIRLGPLHGLVKFKGA